MKDVISSKTPSKESGRAETTVGGKGTEEKTVGGNTFYNIKLGKITPLDVTANLLEDSDDGRAYQLFKNDIEAKNEQVMEKYHAHLKKYANDSALVSKVTNA